MDRGPIVIWVVGLAFLAVQVLIGWWASRRIDNEQDFFVAGRRLGLGLVTFSLFATWFGAETCLGSSGAVYAEGLSGARADPLGYGLCLVLVGVLLARGLHRGRYVTLGDLFRRRFGVRVETLAIVLLIPSGLVWGAAQVRAFGQVLAATTDLPVQSSVWIAATLSIAYTSLGGLLGDVVTDAVQGLLVISGLVALSFFVLSDLPDPETLKGALSVPRLRFSAPGESLLATLDRWSVPILGSLVAQELVARVLAAKSASVARSGAFASAGLYLVVGALPVLLGLLGPAYVSPLDEPEQLLLVLAEKFLGPVFGLVFAFALLSAILSTIDSILLSTSALVSHNLLSRWVTEDRFSDKERAKLWLGRGVLILSGLFCLLVALYAEGIYSLVETASALGTAGVLVVTLAGLYDRCPSRRGALLALVVGAGATPLFEFLADRSEPLWGAPYLSSIGAAALAYVVTRYTDRSTGRPEPRIPGMLP